MRPKSPDYIRNVEDLYLNSIAPIEDGNTNGNFLDKGVIYVTESIDINDPKVIPPAITGIDYYNTGFKSPILSLSPKYSQTGYTYTYEIVVEYTAAEGASPLVTNPGLYGSNLFKSGDFFTVISQNDSHDYIRGLVIDVLDVAVSGPFGDEYTYEYNLLCNINEGDPLKMDVGDYFVWRRQIFTDKNNQKISSPPINLLSTLRDGKVFFRWLDPTDSARKYNLRIRQERQSDGGGITYYFIPGTNANGTEQIVLTPFIGSTGTYVESLTTVKIENTGRLYSRSPEINIVGTGTGANVSVFLDNNGSVKKEFYYIYDADDTTSTIYIQNRNVEQIPKIPSYVEGLGSDLFVSSVTGASGASSGHYEINLNYASGASYGFTGTSADLIGKGIFIHNGALVQNQGSNYKRIAYAQVTQYETDDIYYLNKGTVTATGTLGYGDYYWSVCSIFDESDKNYTEWSVEYPLNVR